MLNAAHIRRRWKRYLVTGILGLVIGLSLITGFAADVGVAALARMPEINSVYLMSEPGLDFGPASLEEAIIGSDVVARARLNSVSQVVEFHDYSVGETAYTRALEFNFDVLEYLKGGGGEQLVAVAYDLDTPFNTRAGAALLGEDFLDERDTQWDDREAIVFLNDNHPALPSSSEPDRYWFGHLRFSGKDRYTIASEQLKLWLPAARSGGATGAVGTSTQRFLTDVPSASGGVAGASGASGVSPSITLSELSAKMVEVERTVREGDGSDEYRECVYRKYKWAREVRYETKRIGKYYGGQREHDLQSGLAADSEVFRYAYGGSYLNTYGPTAPVGYEGMFWLEGEDRESFSVTYPGVVYTARPLPEGDYRFYFNDVPKEYVICDAKPEAERQRDERLVHVTAPDGTLHEAFFDPADIGSAVGSDTDNGVLEPASFRLEGVGKVSIDRIDWQSERVEVELDPHSATGFGNHHIDFLALDGTVALRLDFDDAVEVERDGTRALAWSVCDRPWDDGDLLMLRMSASESDLTGATNDTPCSPPQNLAATSTHESVTLTWDAPDDTTVTGYRIFRREPGQDTFVQFDVSGATTTTYVDTSEVQPVTKYIYRVHTVYPGGLSDVARIAITTLETPDG